MTTTWIRPERHPHTAGALRGEADLDGVFCPICTYAMTHHERTTNAGVTVWRCPTEAEARALSGSQ